MSKRVEKKSKVKKTKVSKKKTSKKVDKKKTVKKKAVKKKPVKKRVIKKKPISKKSIKKEVVKKRKEKNKPSKKKIVKKKPEKKKIIKEPAKTKISKKEVVKKPLVRKGTESLFAKTSFFRDAMTKKPVPKLKVPTGIEGFDKLTKGGLEKNTANLIVGDAGSGKTIFAIEYLINGIKKNEPGLYITFEEEKGFFYNNMKDFGWDLEKLEKKGDFFFLHYNPKKVRTMLEEGGGIIENIVLKNNIKRIVIDSVTSFVILFEEEIKKREAAISLFNMLRSWDCTTLLTYEGDPLRKGIDSEVMEFESDAIIFLYYERVKRERQRFLEIIKMRGSQHSKNIYNFEVDKGIKIIGRPFVGKLKS